MKKECKICLAPYKLGYALLFMLVMGLIRGVSDISQIGGALDSNIALLAIVFCADSYETEYLGKRWEVFRLLPAGQRAKAVRRRLADQMAYLCLISFLGYWCFYWQKPGNFKFASPVQLYGQYLLAAAVTVIFWSLLAWHIVTLLRNVWAGIGISLILWLAINSVAGQAFLGKWSIFSYGFRYMPQYGEFDWLWGKGLAFLLSIALLALIPAAVKRRDR